MNEHLSSQRVSNLKTLFIWFSSSKGFFKKLSLVYSQLFKTFKMNINEENMIVKNSQGECLVIDLKYN
jgi:hypothetical protein